MRRPCGARGAGRVVEAAGASCNRHEGAVLHCCGVWCMPVPAACSAPLQCFQRLCCLLCAAFCAACTASPCIRTPPAAGGLLIHPILSCLLRPTPPLGPLPPRPSSPQVCYAISQLASGFYEQRGTSPMSPYFKDIVQALLETVGRELGGWGGEGDGQAGVVGHIDSHVLTACATVAALRCWHWHSVSY